MSTTCQDPHIHAAPSGRFYADLKARFSPRRAAYVLHVLTPEELSVISDLKDALIIARIKRMPLRRLQRFDALVPAAESDERLYCSLQVNWLKDEEYLLGTRLGRRPTHSELFADFKANHQGLRFRAYFTMKHPRRMRRKPAHARAACSN